MNAINFRYVADKMGGPVEKDRLTFFSWELPLSQIKFDMKSNVIPIGKVKIGIHIHRALLFKVCNYNRYWCISTAAENKESIYMINFLCFLYRLQCCFWPMREL